MLKVIVFIAAMYSPFTIAADYSPFFLEGDDIATSAHDIISNKVEQKHVLVWLGRVTDISVYTNKDGATSIEWFCEQYPFKGAVPMPLNEPFHIAANPTGSFVVTINLPDLSIADAQEKIVKQLKDPSWVLVRGEAEFVQPYKGTNAVYLHSLKAAISDTIEVKLDGRIRGQYP